MPGVTPETSSTRKGWIKGGALDKWIKGEGKRIASFTARLAVLSPQLEAKTITDKDFWNSLKGGAFRTFVPEAETPWQYIVERKEGKLFVSQRQQEEMEIPQVTVQVGLRKGELAVVGEVRARILDYKTAESQQVAGDEQVGARLLDALKNNFKPS